MRPPATNGNKKRDKLGDNMGDELGNKLGDKPGDKMGDKWNRARGDKTLGRRTHHPTQAHIRGDNWRQWETMGDNGRQDLGKADTPSNTGTHVKKQWEKMRNKTPGRHTIQHRHTCGETMGDKAWGRRAHHPTQAHMWGNNGKQGGTRPREADMPSTTGTHVGRKWETMRDKERQDFRKADTPYNHGTHVGRHCVEARGDKTSGRRTHHQTQAHMWGDNGRQWKTMGDKER